MTRAGELYGQSLYDLAVSESISDEILKEMETVKTIFAENPDYVTLLSEPSIPKKERLSLLDEAFGSSLQEYLLNFIKILVEKGLLRSFSACFKRYRASYNSDHGIEDAVVTSAIPLKADSFEQLKKKLEAMTGKTIVLRQKVDPDVLGGIKVELEDRLYDGTVKGRLKELGKKFDETVL